MNLKKQQEMEDDLFDLQGYLILPAALSGREIEKLTQAIDACPELEPGQWHGHVQRQNPPPTGASIGRISSRAVTVLRN